MMGSDSEQREAIKCTAALHMAVISQSAKDILAARARLKDSKYSNREKRRASKMLEEIDRWSKITSHEDSSLLASVKAINAYFSLSDREPIHYHVVRELLFQDPAKLDIPIGGNIEGDDGAADAERYASLLLEGYSAYREDLSVRTGSQFPVAEQVQFDI